jgi:nucleoid-associated protein EbfC
MNPFELAKQMKTLQAEMKKAREELASQSVTGSAANGAVTIELSGSMQVRRVRIDPALREGREAARLEQYVAEALTAALGRAQKLAAAQLSRLTPGMPPGAFH